MPRTPLNEDRESIFTWKPHSPTATQPAEPSLHAASPTSATYASSSVGSRAATRPIDTPFR